MLVKGGEGCLSDWLFTGRARVLFRPYKKNWPVFSANPGPSSADINLKYYPRTAILHPLDTIIDPLGYENCEIAFGRNRTEVAEFRLDSASHSAKH